MKKFRVMGTTVVTVYKEVWANNEDEAMEKVENQLSSLTAYCGNGGCDKLVGVDDSDESVEADGYIEWSETECSKMILVTLNVLNVEKNAGREKMLKATSTGGVMIVNKPLTTMETKFIPISKKMKNN